MGATWWVCLMTPLLTVTDVDMIDTQVAKKSFLRRRRHSVRTFALAHTGLDTWTDHDQPSEKSISFLGLAVEHHSSVLLIEIRACYLIRVDSNIPFCQLILVAPSRCHSDAIALLVILVSQQTRFAPCLTKSCEFYAQPRCYTSIFGIRISTELPKLVKSGGRIQ